MIAPLWHHHLMSEYELILRFPLTFRAAHYPDDYPCPLASDGIVVGAGWRLLVCDAADIVEQEITALLNTVPYIELIHRMERPPGFHKPLDINPPLGKVGWYQPYKPYLPYCLQVSEIPAARGMSFALSTSELLDEHPDVKARIQWVIRDVSRRARSTCVECGGPSSHAHSRWRSLCGSCASSIGQLAQVRG